MTRLQDGGRDTRNGWRCSLFHFGSETLQAQSPITGLKAWRGSRARTGQRKNEFERWLRIHVELRFRMVRLAGCSKRLRSTSARGIITTRFKHSSDPPLNREIPISRRLWNRRKRWQTKRSVSGFSVRRLVRPDLCELSVIGDASEARGF
jgi:hypothetical protein